MYVWWPARVIELSATKTTTLADSASESKNATISPPNVAKSQLSPVFATFKVQNVAIWHEFRHFVYVSARFYSKICMPNPEARPIVFYGCMSMKILFIALAKLTWLWNEIDPVWFIHMYQWFGLPFLPNFSAGSVMKISSQMIRSWRLGLFQCPSFCQWQTSNFGACSNRIQRSLRYRRSGKALQR